LVNLVFCGEIVLQNGGVVVNNVFFPSKEARRVRPESSFVDDLLLGLASTPEVTVLLQLEPLQALL